MRYVSKWRSIQVNLCCKEENYCNKKRNYLTKKTSYCSVAVLTKTEPSFKVAVGNVHRPKLNWQPNPQDKNQLSYGLQIRPSFCWCKKNWILTVQKFFVENHQFDCDLNYSFFQQKFGHPRVRILFYTIIPLNLTLFVRRKDWQQIWSF